MGDALNTWASEIDIHMESTTPLYAQVKDGLQAWIENGLESGALVPGGRIPSENELSDGLGVSVITVRRALDELKRQGYIKRIQGRGSFISAPPKLVFTINQLFSLTTLTLDKGMQPSRKILELTRISAGRTVAKRLNLSIGDLVAKLVRLRLMNDMPVVIDTSYIPLSVFPGLMSEYKEGDSLYELMTQKYESGPVRAHDVLETILINSFESEVLRVPVGSPAILIERVAYDQADTPVEFAKSVFRGDVSRFSINLEENNPYVDDESSAERDS